MGTIMGRCCAWRVVLELSGAARLRITPSGRRSCSVGQPRRSPEGNIPKNRAWILQPSPSAPSPPPWLPSLHFGPPFRARALYGHASDMHAINTAEAAWNVEGSGSTPNKICVRRLEGGCCLSLSLGADSKHLLYRTVRSVVDAQLQSRIILVKF